MPKKILKTILILLPILAFIIITFLISTEKYSFKQIVNETITNLDGTYSVIQKEQFTNVGVMFIIIGCIAFAVVVYLIVTFMRKQKPKTISIIKQVIYPPLDVRIAKKTLVKKLVMDNIISGALDVKGNLIEGSCSNDEFEFGSQRTSYHEYYDKLGYNSAKFLDIVLRIKNPYAPSNIQGSHWLHIPLTREQDILNENLDFLERRYKFKVDRKRADFPQKIEPTLEEKRMDILEKLELPDIDIAMKGKEPSEARELARIGREIAKSHEDFVRTIEEQQRMAQKE